MAEKDCGCTPGIELTNPGGAKTFITYCPKHAAVDDLIAALEGIKGQKCYCYMHGAEEDDPDCPHEIAQGAIRKAQIPAGAKG